VARSLVATVSQLNLSTAQYAAAWKTLFGGATSTAADPHLGLPTIGLVNTVANVAAVQFFANGTKTDRAMRIRVTASGAGNVNATTDCVTITFASEWKDSSGQPVVPAVLCSAGFNATAVTSTSFVLTTTVLIGSSTFSDVAIIISGGGNANSN
jgi:hypothetical protein